MSFRRAAIQGLVALSALTIPATAEAARVVFLNADAVNINADNGQNPSLDSYSTTGFTAGPLGGWPTLTDAQKDEIVYIMKEASVDLDVTYTWERPAAGLYDMVVMGSEADNAARFPGLGCSGAVGLADCGDMNAENVSFLFWGCIADDQQDNMDRIAHTMFTALGFGWGLENTTASGQIMGSYFDNGESVQFSSQCATITGGAGTCMDHPGCAAGQQDAMQELTQRLGARIDDGPPSVMITEPLDGAMVPNDFTIAADVADGFGGLEVLMSIVEVDQTQPDEDPPYAWNVEGVPDGTWSFNVAVTDADGNNETHLITVCVGETPCIEGGSGDSGTGDSGTDTGAVLDESGGDGDSTTGEVASSSSDDGGGGGDTGPIDPTVPPSENTFGASDPETGCSCRSTSDGSAWLLMLLAIPLLRRRRN